MKSLKAGKAINPALAAYREKVAFAKAVQTAVEMTLRIASVVLKDKHSFTEEQLQQFEADVVYQYDSVAQGYTSFEDYNEARNESEHDNTSEI